MFIVGLHGHKDKSEFSGRLFGCLSLPERHQIPLHFCVLTSEQSASNLRMPHCSYAFFQTRVRLVLSLATGATSRFRGREKGDRVSLHLP